ncbi:hypothetical protein SLE2022_314020 [Rubroshorea leprosula]
MTDESRGKSPARSRQPCDGSKRQRSEGTGFEPSGKERERRCRAELCWARESEAEGGRRVAKHESWLRRYLSSRLPAGAREVPDVANSALARMQSNLFLT